MPWNNAQLAMHDKTQSLLLRWAAFYLFLQSAILTLAPAVREQSWDVDYRLSHWWAWIVWLLLTQLADRATRRYLPERDPYLLPAAALLSGWGLLSIWRLDETFGIRQTIWFGLIMLTILPGLGFQKQILALIRRYKYLLLAGGLLITSLTLILGTNPLGSGPRLWLGCCGVYFQPSEPLKLLLVIYLAAYLADRASLRLFSIHLMVPTLVVSGIAILLLLVQHDLGTASLLISIFTLAIYLFSGKRRVLLSTIFLLLAALVSGYFFIDVIRIRVEGWLNPWADPAGTSFQTVQSLLAIANGGIFGRGLGLGSPLLVPVAISDFIFAAIAEENGLVGVVGLVVLIWLILARGLIISLRAPDRFRRYLAAFLVAYLGIQSLLIMGGNLRIFPLTGVTLPFVSYGGSSLLTSHIALFLLLIISFTEDNEPAPLADPKPYILFSGLLALGFLGIILTSTWWAVVRSPDLLARTDNARRSIADRYVARGDLLDRNNQPITITIGESGSYERQYLIPELAPILGYTDQIYGQAGLEAALDNYLRGVQGNPASTIWWDRLLYGMPPPGLDIRLSLSLNLQAKADQMLGGHSGAVILMNAKTGEILAMSSHPTYDPNHLAEQGEALLQDKNAPLVNRATQSLYVAGTALLPALRAKFGETSPSESQKSELYQDLGYFDPPDINLPAAYGKAPSTGQDLLISPLQAVLTVAALSNGGSMPTARIATAIDSLEQGWVVLPALGSARQVLPAAQIATVFPPFLVEGKPYWMHVGQSSMDKQIITWLLAGTLPDWKGSPLALVITLEENNTYLAKQIGNTLLEKATNE